MSDLIFIWLIALNNWVGSGCPTAKAVLSAKVTEPAMNNVRSEGIGGA